MNIRDYRESLPGRNTRVAFCGWINDYLSQRHLNISIPYLRDLESGRSVPSLALAIAVEDATGSKVKVRDWPGLFKRKHRQIRRNDAVV
jgi:hypothetical protein